MSRNKLTSKCIGENTKIFLKSKTKSHFLSRGSISRSFRPLLNYLSRNSSHHTIIRHILDDYGVGSHNHIVANRYATKHLAAQTQEHVVADGGHACSRGAHGHARINRYVSANPRPSVYDHPTPVIDFHAKSYGMETKLATDHTTIASHLKLMPSRQQLMAPLGGNLMPFCHPQMIEVAAQHVTVISQEPSSQRMVVEPLLLSHLTQKKLFGNVRHMHYCIFL